MIDPDGSAILGYTQTLYQEHLGEAVDACIRARRFMLEPAGRRPKERRSAVTSIVRGYAGMEAVANIHRFEVFENEGGRYYAPAASDDAPVQRYLENWDRQPLEERYQYLLKVRGGDPLDANTLAHMGEVRRLRHLLAHGHDAPGLLMIDAQDRSNVEIEVRKKAFPHLKFSDFDKLNHGDARKALEVVLRATHHLGQAFGGFLLSCVSYELEPGGALRNFGGRHNSVDALLGEIDSAA